MSSISLGIGAYAKLVIYDDTTVIYEYGGYNLNQKEYRNEDRVLDGTITISRSCFAEPEIHERIKKTPSGRKKTITKRIPISVDYLKMIGEGAIVVENCGNCWHTLSENNIDDMALRILFLLFQQYQEEGKLPENISYNV